MEITAIVKKESADAQVELVRDLISIVTSFSVRLYGTEGGKKIRLGFRVLIAGAEPDEKAEE